MVAAHCRQAHHIKEDESRGRGPCATHSTPQPQHTQKTDTCVTEDGYIHNMCVCVCVSKWRKKECILVCHQGDLGRGRPPIAAAWRYPLHCPHLHPHGTTTMCSPPQKLLLKAVPAGGELGIRHASDSVCTGFFCACSLLFLHVQPHVPQARVVWCVSAGQGQVHGKLGRGFVVDAVAIWLPR